VRRFRLLFIGLTLALLLPVGLLVRRAMESVGLERRMRHQTLAERVFDEMERALSAFLAREEERPFGQYGFYQALPGQLPGSVAVTRSPLAELPELPFVVGYFQIDPDGTVHSPLRPREGEPAPPGWQLSAPARTRIAAVEETVANQWRTAAAPRERQAEELPGPGATVGVKEKDESLAGRIASSDDALRALNKAVEQRGQRQAKLSREYASGAIESEAGPAHDAVAPMAPPARPGRRDDTRRNEPVQLELPPMSGHAAGARHLLIYRTVVHETRGYRQGLVLDAQQLGAWLQRQALGRDGLAAHATLAFGNAAGPPDGAPTPGAFTYAHRFAEPFGDLHAWLALRPLPGVGGGRFVYTLSLLLLATVGLGLTALYRMVALTVSFAERRSNFAAAVSHELKTPLTAIRMYGEMLRDGIVASEAKRAEYHRHITVEAERLSRLVNNVLELSRLEKGTRQAALVTGPLAPVVREAAVLLRAHVEQAGFALDVDVGDDLPPVRFERDAVLQILFNLVDNAVKYAGGAETRRIEVRARPIPGAVQLTVRDHGPGVPTPHLGRVFEPFYRGESELTRRGKGTGIGLALVRGLADCLGARVSGRNHPDGGFAVELVLPAA
jgi:signal transduction histidine kinase